LWDDQWYLGGSAAGPSTAYQSRFVLNFALPGDHVLYAVARRHSRAPFVRVSQSVAFESGRTAAALDLGAHPGGPTAGAYFAFDGHRLDAVPARYGRPGAPDRFTALIPTGTLDPGRHTIEPLVVARGWIGYYAPLPPIVVYVLPKMSEEDEGPAVPPAPR
jgi:hypothetical protein